MTQHSLYPGPAPTIDGQLLTRLLEELDGDAESLAMLLQEYLDDAPRLLQQMNAALINQDAAALGSAAHTLKSTSASFGAAQLAALCAELSLKARGEGTNDWPELVARIAAELARVRALIVGSSSAPDSSVDVAALFRRIG